MCVGLRPKSTKIPGSGGCPDGFSEKRMSLRQFVRDQRTSAAIDYAHADGLMQLGRKAARKAKPELQSALRACVEGR